jgi:hypothetical protein
MSLFPEENVSTKEIESWKAFVDGLKSEDDRKMFLEMLEKCQKYTLAINAKGKPFSTEPFIMAREIEDLEKNVNGFHEYRRERLRFIESNVFNWINDVKRMYEKTIQEYSYLFHHVLTMVCPLLLRLSSESNHTVEE